MNKRIAASAIAFVGVIVLAPITAYAATTASSELSQQITEGTLSTDIRDESGNILSNPTFTMNSVIASTSQQTATGTFGSNTQRITVDNPGGADGGWTLALNATTPGSGTWTSGGDSYAYNGATAADGQLTVNPAAGSITGVVGGATGVSLGSSATFSGSGAITLATADASSADIWNGYITGISLSQTIPAGQAIGTYTLDMTQTVTAS